MACLPVCDVKNQGYEVVAQKGFYAVSVPGFSHRTYDLVSLADESDGGIKADSGRYACDKYRLAHEILFLLASEEVYIYGIGISHQELQSSLHIKPFENDLV